MTGSRESDRPPPESERELRDEDDSWGDLAIDAGARRVDAGDVAEPGAQPTGSPDGRQRLDGIRLLVVESSAVRAEAARTDLEALGAAVAAGGPDEGGYLRALEFRPDVVLSDLTTPGEPGWWLFQRFRRQPLLRWMPVLLMRWWEEGPDGAVRPLVQRVAERVGEIMAPIRVIEERIAAGRALADRVEVTGVPALLKLLSGAGLSGILSINDSWNVFELALARGRLRAVRRRGVDGETDSGQEAFAQLLLCDSGRWSFRLVDTSSQPASLEGGLEEALIAAGGQLAALFGPAATFGLGSAGELGVRRQVLRDVASSLSGSGKQLVEALASGISEAEVDALVRTPADIVGAERSLVSLMRCGAIRPFAGAVGEERDEAAGRVAGAVAHLLSRIAEDHRAVPTADTDAQGGDEDGAGGEQPAAGRGFYQVSKVTAERVAGMARRSMRVPGASIRPQVGRIDLTPGDSAKLQFEAGTPTPVLEPESMAWAAGLRSSTVEAGQREADRGAVMLHDSLVPAPPAGRADKGRRQMWLALALALLLGGLLVIGLVVIGSDSPQHATEIGGP